MKPQRMIAQLTATAALLALGAPVAANAEAGGTLLSGYGGPGQGSQAIIGSGFVNLPGGGGTSGGAGSSPAASTGSTSTSGTATTPAAGSRGGSSGRPTTSAGSRVSGAGIQPGSSGVSPAHAAIVESSSQSLVLPGGDILDILLAVLALGLTAFLTLMLARRRAGTGPTRKDAG
jgi:hypothetical protein